MMSIPEPKCENHFSRCVAINVHIDIKGKSSRNLKRSNINEFQLSLTIDFGCEEEISIPAGRRFGLNEGKVTIGLKRAELEFELSNCEVPLESVLLKSDLDLYYDTEQTSEESGKLDMRIHGTNSQSNLEIGEKKSVTIKRKLALIQKIGNEKSPIWVFRVPLESEFLTGSLTKQPLGNLTRTSTVSNEYMSLKGNLNVRGEDIIISWGKLLFSDNITRNKLAVFERAIALRYVRPMFEGTALCEVEWNYG